jgi:transposase
MPRTRSGYSPQYRQQLVDLVREGPTPEALAREFEPRGQAIRNRLAKPRLKSEQRSDGVTSAEQAELRELLREKRQLSRARS